MQALTAQPTYRQTQNISGAGELSQALGGQLGVADASAKKIQNTMATNVLGTARGQAADAQSGMAQASRLATSEALNRAKNNQLVRGARNTAAAQLVAAPLYKKGGDKTRDFFDALGTAGSI